MDDQFAYIECIVNDYFYDKTATLSERLQVGFNLGSTSFEKWWQGEPISEIQNFFVDRESGAVGGQFKENLIGFAEIETLEIVAINFSAIGYAEVPEPADPGAIVLLIWNTERDMVNTARSRPVGREIRAHPEVQFRGSASCSHFVDLDAEFRFLGIGIFQGRTHAQNLRQQTPRGLRLWNGEGGGSESSDLMGRRYRAA